MELPSEPARCGRSGRNYLKSSWQSLFLILLISLINLSDENKFDLNNIYIISLHCKTRANQTVFAFGVNEALKLHT
jgi:hypothetical protein